MSWAAANRAAQGLQGVHSGRTMGATEKLSRAMPLTAVRGVCDHADAEGRCDGSQPQPHQRPKPPQAAWRPGARGRGINRLGSGRWRVRSRSSSTTGSVLLERDVGVVVRDGVRLSVDVYRPNRPGRFPAILEHIPYRKDDLRAIEDRSQNTFLVQRRVRLRAARRAWHRAARTAWPHDEYTEAEQHDGFDVVRVDGRAAVVHRRGGVVGRLLRRVHVHPAGRAAPAGAAGDRAGLRDRRPLHRRHALPRRRAQRQQPARLSDLDDRDERAAAARRARTPEFDRRLARADRDDAGVGGRVDPRAARRARTGATARCDPTTAGSAARC